jgi:hypothetical protein
MRHIKTGKRNQNQNLFEPIPLNNNQMNEMVDFSDKLDDNTRFDEQVFDFSFENQFETDNTFSVDQLF